MSYKKAIVSEIHIKYFPETSAFVFNRRTFVVPINCKFFLTSFVPSNYLFIM